MFMPVAVLLLVADMTACLLFWLLHLLNNFLFLSLAYALLPMDLYSRFSLVRFILFLLKIFFFFFLRIIQNLPFWTLNW